MLTTRPDTRAPLSDQPRSVSSTQVGLEVGVRLGLLVGVLLAAFAPGMTWLGVLAAGVGLGALAGVTIGFLRGLLRSDPPSVQPSIPPGRTVKSAGLSRHFCWSGQRAVSPQLFEEFGNCQWAPDEGDLCPHRGSAVDSARRCADARSQIPRIAVSVDCSHAPWVDDGWIDMDFAQQSMSRRSILTATALAPLAAATAAPQRAMAAADPASAGQWSAPFDMGGVAIHATLLHNDDVLIFQYVEGQAGVDHTSWVGTWNWRSGASREAPFTYHRDIFCAGHNVLADGRLFIAGGHDHNTGRKQDPIGVAEADIYDPIARTWTPAPSMQAKRWYPTNVGLPTGKVLIFGGQAGPNVPTHTVEEYDARTNAMRQLPATATKPMGLYPRMYLMANGKILRCGPQALSMYFDPATNAWTSVAKMTFGARSRGTVAMLPGAQKVITAGGGKDGSPTATAEILDVSQAAPKWRATAPMTHPRLLANSVVLPDGEVLVVGGGRTFKYTDPVYVPELFDPVTEKWSLMAAHQAGRMYHATALLLPDARVLVAGQDSGALQRFGEVFSPPYLFKGARPSIAGAPATVSHGSRLEFTSAEASDLATVVLIRPGSCTHEINTDQRSVPLPFSVSGTTVTATIPGSVDLAPPGYYMLFVVNRNGVPSVAPWIHVG